MNFKDIHVRELGPYSTPLWLAKISGERELSISNCRTSCHFPHKLNKDVDDYLNDDCYTIISKIHGQFTYDARRRIIVG